MLAVYHAVELSASQKTVSYGSLLVSGKYCGVVLQHSNSVVCSYRAPFSADSMAWAVSKAMSYVKVFTVSSLLVIAACFPPHTILSRSMSWSVSLNTVLCNVPQCGDVTCD